MRPHRQEPADRDAQGGYALLAILVLCSIMAVMLARSLPRDAMSAQRIREENLISRGEQYQRAVKLYFRQYKKYPEELDDLEETDGIRFLRRRYQDPITGEDEWRLIHIGADGRFRDSLIYDTEDEEELQRSGGFGSGFSDPKRRSGVGSGGFQPSWQAAVGAGFGGAERALQVRESAAPDNPMAQAAGPYGGPFPGQEPGEGGQPQLGPDGQPLPPGEGQPDYTQVLPSQVPPEAGQAPPSGQPVPGLPAVGIGLPQSRGGIGSGRNQRNQPGAMAAAPQGEMTGGIQAQDMSPDAQGLLQGLLTTPRPGGLQGLQGGPRGLTQQGAGAAFQEGVAGVASKAEEVGVKVYKGRESYNEWEFVYDYRQDQAAALGAAGAGAVGNINPGQPGLTPSGFLPSPMGGAPPGGLPGGGRGQRGRGEANRGPGGGRGGVGPGGAGPFGARGPGPMGIPPTTTGPITPPPGIPGTTPTPGQPGPGQPPAGPPLFPGAQQPTPNQPGQAQPGQAQPQQPTNTPGQSLPPSRFGRRSN